MHAKITAYKGLLVIEMTTLESIVGEVTCSLDTPGTFGQVINDTAKHLGISEEGIALMKAFKTNRSSLGDIDWFATGEGKHAFGWIGGPFALKDPTTDEGSRDYRVFDGAYVSIPNDVPQGAREAIDAQGEA
ncbi:hypothetical protein HOU03_gp251 [Caulobacter phage CcrSC]|uniref:Uncharacterized protein n=1 Tax=Caulobacter phage CcrSC TaxID=2283272 RepID=A0A385EGI1_9CAUD|nr:hypothetical protein HOU03_gp251 [Caulobacter phage CcrSC]AXQ70017.1 hypothetical protein CcrSC_gp435 [Caulobacter phage CcrSC]